MLCPVELWAEIVYQLNAIAADQTVKLMMFAKITLNQKS